MLERDNLETLSRFRGLDFSSIYESAWFNVEEQLNLELTGEDLVRYVDVNTEFYSGFEEL